MYISSVYSDSEGYACKICKKQFSHEVGLNIHFRSHVKEKSFFICDVCQEIFLQQSDLQEHYNIHSEEKPYKCKFCNKRFSSEVALNVHSRNHTKGRSYVCEKCPWIFSKSSDYYNHVLTHEESFVCVICEMVFPSKETLNKHLKTHIEEEGTSSDIYHEVAAVDVQNEHGATEKSFISKENPFTFASSLQRDDLSSQDIDKQNFACDLCKKSFLSKNDLKEHPCSSSKKKPLVLDLRQELSSQDIDFYDAEAVEGDLSADECQEASSEKDIHLNIHIDDLFICELCQQAFTDKKDLKQHLSTHEDKNSFECGVCHKIFNEKLELNRHLGCHISNFTCGICQENFSSESDFHMHCCSHIVEHSVCAISQKISPQSDNLHGLKVTHKLEFTCPSCKKKFAQKQQYEEHLRMHAGKKPYKCSVCHVAYRHKSNLKRHLSSHLNLTCGECNEEFSEQSLFIRHAKTHEKKCGICEKIFLYHKDFSEHIGTCLKESSFTCKTCQKVFRRKSSLNIHLLTHKAEKNFKCFGCCIVFPNERVYRYHPCKYKKPFTCDQCRKGFFIKDDLIDHYRTHTGEKPFECSICNRAFHKKILLLNHFRMHADDQDEEEISYPFDLQEETHFTCDLCQKEFSQKRKLRDHIRTHIKAFKCDVCERRFSNRGSLNAHLRKHTGEKPFACGKCEKTFARRFALLKHSQTCTGDSSDSPKAIYICDVCQSAFPEELSFLEHVLIHENCITCSKCDAKFSQKQDLEIHYQMHTKKEDSLKKNLNTLFEKEFQSLYTCEICERSFISKDFLKKHFCRHMGEEKLECSYCQQSYSTESELHMHLPICKEGSIISSMLNCTQKPQERSKKPESDSETGFTCDVCFKDFPNKQKLWHHQRIHKKPFSCDICSKSFSLKGGLNMHMRIHGRRNFF